MSNVELSNEVKTGGEMKRPVRAKTMREAKPEEYKKLKKARRARRIGRREKVKAAAIAAGLKRFKPNASLSADKASGKKFLAVFKDGTADLLSFEMEQ